MKEYRIDLSKKIPEEMLDKLLILPSSCLIKFCIGKNGSSYLYSNYLFDYKLRYDGDYDMFIHKKN
jgi:hypothetical protein